MSEREGGERREWMKTRADEWTTHARMRSFRTEVPFSWPCVPLPSRSSLNPRTIFRDFPPFACPRVLCILSSRRSSSNHLNLRSSLNISQELWGKRVSLRNEPEANVTRRSSFFPYLRSARRKIYFHVFMSALTLTPTTSSRGELTTLCPYYTRLVIIGGSNDRAKVTT